jgi:hypothetical protein
LIQVRVISAGERGLHDQRFYLGQFDERFFIRRLRMTCTTVISRALIGSF